MHANHQLTPVATDCRPSGSKAPLPTTRSQSRQNPTACCHTHEPQCAMHANHGLTPVATDCRPSGSKAPLPTTRSQTRPNPTACCHTGEPQCAIRVSRISRDCKALRPVGGGPGPVAGAPGARQTPEKGAEGDEEHQKLRLTTAHYALYWGVAPRKLRGVVALGTCSLTRWIAGSAEWPSGPLVVWTSGGPLPRGKELSRSSY